MKSNNENILVFNCGSSSIKYQIIKMPEETVLIKGEAERVGVKGEARSYILHNENGEENTYYIDMPDYQTGFEEIFKLLNKSFSKNPGFIPTCIGHRYVHGGNNFNKTSRVDVNVLPALKKTFSFAPLHNPLACSIIEGCLKKMPDVPEYVVVDTSFHNTIPQEHYTYPLPKKLMTKYQIRKYGFHGTSHKYVMQKACEHLNRAVNTQKIISCHLGSGGSSLCAINYGQSIDNTMGFTPLAGLVMNTRSGDIDPSLPFYIMHFNNISFDDANNLLNKKSGLLGVAEFSSDLRDIVKYIDTNPQAKMAFNMYIKRAKEYIGAYFMLLQQFDILIFTDTLGTKIPLVREKICSGMENLGIILDKEKNDNYSGGIMDISSGSSIVRIMVLSTNEELMIAKESYVSKNGGI